jgi:hypothetical protein
VDDQRVLQGGCFKKRITGLRYKEFVLYSTSIRETTKNFVS